jgi:hypothetical protein
VAISIATTEAAPILTKLGGMCDYDVSCESGKCKEMSGCGECFLRNLEIDNFRKLKSFFSKAMATSGTSSQCVTNNDCLSSNCTSNKCFGK